MCLPWSHTCIWDFFTGERCEIEVDECTSFPCQNGGSCVDNFISYSCVCPQGFSGTNCEIDIDECNSSPCKFGTCKDGIQGFVCYCFEEYTGLCFEMIFYVFNFRYELYLILLDLWHFKTWKLS